ncbi:MAG: beta strand repeat-containing protein [Prosthecobacter sp.]
MELYDPGQPLSPASRPQVTAATFDSARVLSITGSGLRGVSGGSTGGVQDSSSGFPLVQLRSLGNAQLAWAAPASWSATGFTSDPLPLGLPPGHLLMTVFTNGVQSESKVVMMPLPADIAVEQPAGTNIVDGGSQGFGSRANGTSAPLAFTIRNSGGSALALGGVSVTGGNAADFVVSTTGMSSSLAGGDSTTFSVTFTPSATGSRSTTLQIFSDDTDEATFDITLTGTGLNNAPTITDIADQTVNEDGATSALPFTIGDFETSSLTVTRASSNTTLVPLANVVLGGNGAARTVTVTPAANLSGTATITVTVNDGTASTSDTFLLTVNAVDDVPTLNSISNPTAILEDAGQQTINLSGISAGGGESQALTVNATSDNPGLIPHPTVTYTSPGTTGSIRYTPVANMNGTAMITVTVDDGESTVGRSFTVSVTATNDAPTLNTIGNPEAILEDAALQSISLSGISAGPGENQTLVVTAVSNNTALIPHPTVTYSSPDAAGSLSYTPVANATGSATIIVTVNDGQASNNTLSRTFTVAVTAVNDAPTLSSISNPVAILEDATQQTVSLGGITAGPNESQTLAITATSDNTAVIPHPTVVYTSPSTTGSLRYTPVANMSGTATITVTVNDGQAADNTITQIFTVTVSAVNDPPTLDVIGSPTAILEDAGVQSITLNGVSSGPHETQSLVITAVSDNTALIPHPTVTYATPNASISYTPVANANGTAVITVTIDDGQASNNTISRSFTVSVTAVNDAPTLANLSSATTLEDTSTNAIGFTVNDLESSPGTLTLTGSSNNTALVSNGNITFGGSGQNRTITVTPASNQSGSAVITVNVSDGFLTTSDTFILTVDAVNDVPTITAVADQVITYNTLTNALSFTLGDIETASALLGVTGSSSNQTLLADSSIYLSGSGSSRDVTLVPEFNQTGSATVTLRVSDGTDTTTTSFTLTVNAPEIVVEQPFGSNLADGGSRSFGSVAVGASGNLVFYIKNTNAASLTGLSITKDGPDASQFSVTASPVAPVVGPSGNTAFTVQFAPTSSGDKTATLHIANNDPNEHPFDITLTGRGAIPRSNWRQTHFGTSANTGSAADLADPDHDGLPNLLEYALGMNPGQSSNGQVPLAQLASGEFVLVFDEPVGITEVTYGAEWNGTLNPAEWSSAGISHVFSNGRHTFTLPAAGLGKAYMRLKVVSTP